MPRKLPRRRTYSPYAGPTTCLRCDERFDSWDVRQNRLCPRCHQALDEQVPEDPPYQVLKPRRWVRDE